jgi:hypothetical protein
MHDGNTTNSFKEIDWHSKRKSKIPYDYDIWFCFYCQGMVMQDIALTSAITTYWKTL